MGFFYSQLFVTPPKPTRSFANETVIVTGANTGLGLEAARHIARLGCSHLILACRNTDAGEKAKQDIISNLPSSTTPGTIEVWPLDLSSYVSITSFASRCNKSLSRLDALLASAGIATATFKLTEGHESTIAVNVLGTFLLCLLLIPKLESTAAQNHPSATNLPPRITIVSSEVHKMTEFKQQHASNIFTELDKGPDSGAPDAMKDRYPLSKLIQILLARYGLAPRLAEQESPIVLTYLNPGLCKSELNREGNLMVNVMKTLVGRTQEVGGRTLVAGIGGNVDGGSQKEGNRVFVEGHGKYMSDGAFQEGELGEWVKSEEGRKVGEKLWGEMLRIFERVDGVEKKGLGRWQ